MRLNTRIPAIMGRVLVACILMASLAGIGKALAGEDGAGTAGSPKTSRHSPAADHREPLSIDEVEIHGELLVPQAVYIVAGAEDDAAASASVLDYLNALAPGSERIGLLLILDQPSSGLSSFSSPYSAGCGGNADGN